MNPILRNILALIIGLAVGMVCNMGLINVGHSIYPIPGLDPEDMESLAAIFPTLDLKYFIFPFLAHALGTFMGAVVASYFAATRKMTFAISIGCFFFIGGVMVNAMIGGPIWFIAIDLVLAYIPMAWIAGKLGIKLSKS